MKTKTEQKPKGTSTIARLPTIKPKQMIKKVK